MNPCKSYSYILTFTVKIALLVFYHFCPMFLDCQAHSDILVLNVSHAIGGCDLDRFLIFSSFLITSAPLSFHDSSPPRSSPAP